MCRRGLTCCRWRTYRCSRGSSRRWRCGRNRLCRWRRNSRYHSRCRSSRLGNGWHGRRHSSCRSGRNRRSNRSRRRRDRRRNLRRTRCRGFCGHARSSCNWRGRGCSRRRPHPLGLSRRIFRVFFRFGCGFRGSLGFRLPQNILANFLRNVFWDRARVRLLLRDAIPRQKVNDRFGLHLEFAGQLVDSNLICVAHASYGLFSNQNTQ